MSYAVEFIVQLPNEPVLKFAAIDPKAGVSGGLLFALWLILGNVVNAFMEEGLFRGVMGRLFRIRLSFWGANILQAFLFGLWHLPWVLKWYQTGQLEEHGGPVMATLIQFLPMLAVGFAWGYFYFKTGSLWVSWMLFTFSATASLTCCMWARPRAWTLASRYVGPVSMFVTLLSHAPGQVPGRALPDARGQALGPMGTRADRRRAMLADRYIVNVEGAIVKDGRYLMVVRGEEEYAPGGLNFPGGKVEGAVIADDVLEETLRREIAEEVGLEVHAEMAYLRSSAFVAEGGVAEGVRLQPVVTVKKGWDGRWFATVGLFVAIVVGMRLIENRFEQKTQQPRGEADL